MEEATVTPDLTIEIDDLGVMHIDAQTEEGEDFLDSLSMENMQVIDSGRIALLVSMRENFEEAARNSGLTVDG